MQSYRKASESNPSPCRLAWRRNARSRTRPGLGTPVAASSAEEGGQGPWPASPTRPARGQAALLPPPEWQPAPTPGRWASPTRAASAQAIYTTGPLVANGPKCPAVTDPPAAGTDHHWQSPATELPGMCQAPVRMHSCCGEKAFRERLVLRGSSRAGRCTEATTPRPNRTHLVNHGA